MRLWATGELTDYELVGTNAKSRQERVSAHLRPKQNTAGVLAHLRSQRGETLIETLTALMVAVVVMLFLSTSIVAAVKINKRVRAMDNALDYESTIEPINEVIVTIAPKTVSTEEAYKITGVQSYTAQKTDSTDDKNTATYHYYSKSYD